MKNRGNFNYRQWVAMTRSQILSQLAEKLSKKRYDHTLRVEETALHLADKYGANLEKTSLAALLHDYAKEEPDHMMSDRVISENMDLEMLDYGNAIWHGPVGAVLVREELGITDEEILAAIAEHTIGAPKMSLISQIVFVADYIEPARDFPAVRKAREIAADSLEAAVFFEMKETLIHLLENKQTIYPKTLENYNAWVDRTKGECIE